MIPQSMESFRGKHGNSTDHIDTIWGCDTCNSGKRQEEAHPKKPTHKMGGPVKLNKSHLVMRLQPPGEYSEMLLFDLTIERVTWPGTSGPLSPRVTAVSSPHVFEHNRLGPPRNRRLGLPSIIY